MQNLDLHFSQVADAGITELREPKGMQELDLFGLDQVTDVGVKELSGLKHLQSLSLADSQMTDTGLTHLAKMKSLEMLELSDSQTTDNGIAILKKALPACRILNRNLLPSPTENDSMMLGSDSGADIHVFRFFIRK